MIYALLTAFNFGVLAGGSTCVSTETAVVPFVNLSVDAELPVYSENVKNYYPHLGVNLFLNGLPGQTVDVSKVDTFKSVETHLELSQPIINREDQRISLFAEAGFSTRLPKDNKPRDETARFGAIGISASRNSDASYIKIGIGADQRLDGLYRLTTLIEGQIKIYENSGVRMVLGGDAILDLSGMAHSDVVRIYIGVGK